MERVKRAGRTLLQEEVLPQLISVLRALRNGARPLPRVPKRLRGGQAPSDTSLGGGRLVTRSGTLLEEEVSRW